MAVLRLDIRKRLAHCRPARTLIESKFPETGKDSHGPL